MNCEILFRGKCPDTGEWVHGWYCPNPFGRVPLKDAIVPSEEATDGYYTFVKVIPDTIGQFTGLLDKTGKKIFEGDIVTDKWQNVCEVRFDRGEYALGRNGSLYQWIGICAADCTIIGNIHDNPELIGGESK